MPDPVQGLAGFPSLGVAFESGLQYSESAALENQMAKLSNIAQQQKVDEGAMALAMMKAAQPLQQQALDMASKQLATLGQGGGAGATGGGQAPSLDEMNTLPRIAQIMSLKDVGTNPEKAAQGMAAAALAMDRNYELYEKQSKMKQARFSWIADSSTAVDAIADPVERQKQWESLNTAGFQRMFPGERNPLVDPKTGKVADYSPLITAELRAGALDTVKQEQIKLDQMREKQAAQAIETSKANEGVLNAKKRNEDQIYRIREKTGGVTTADAMANADLQNAINAAGLGNRIFGKVPAKEIPSRLSALRDKYDGKSNDEIVAILKDQAAQDVKTTAKEREAAEMKTSAVQQIDDLISLVKTSPYDVTGAKGEARTYIESGKAVLGSRAEEPAKKFESGLTNLQLQLSVLEKMPGQFSKLKADEIRTVLRGRNIGDNPKATIDSLITVRKILAGARTDTGSKAPQSERSVVRTGTFNGRKVVQYSDGSTAYAD